MDRKIACETLADCDEVKPPEEGNDVIDDQPDVPPDFPPESFWISKDAELDWFDQHAFYERKDSTKGNSNSTNLNPHINPGSNSNSQRFSKNLKSKAAIIGLPKTQKTSYVDVKNRKNGKVGNTRLFPKRSVSTGKSDGVMIEPSSPKVSCMGRVRSKRDRKRRLRKNRQSSNEPAMDKTKKPAERRKTGLLATLRSMFRSKAKLETHDALGEWSGSPSRVSNSRRTRRFTPVDLDVPSSEIESFSRRSVDSETPGLGGMQRFVSGRRSDSWVGEVGVNST